MLHFQVCIFKICHEIHWISCWNLPDFFMKSAGFHEICQISLWNCQISWWNPPDFIVKSARFHEIHLISSWNPLDFMVKSADFIMKSTRFHGEICWISLWNPPDFMKYGGFHDAKWTKDPWSYFSQFNLVGCHIWIKKNLHYCYDMAVRLSLKYLNSLWSIWISRHVCISFRTDCDGSLTPTECVFSSEITSWRKCQIAMCQLEFTHIL